MKIKVVKCTPYTGAARPISMKGPWYYSRIGEIFEVEPMVRHDRTNEYVYFLKDEPLRKKGMWSYLKATDCEVIEDDLASINS